MLGTKAMVYAVVQDNYGDVPDSVDMNDYRIISYHELSGDAVTFCEALKLKYKKDRKRQIRNGSPFPRFLFYSLNHDTKKLRRVET